jgi:hypothetical protein
MGIPVTKPTGRENREKKVKKSFLFGQIQLELKVCHRRNRIRYTFEFSIPWRVFSCQKWKSYLVFSALLSAISLVRLSEVCIHVGRIHT